VFNQDAKILIFHLAAEINILASDFNREAIDKRALFQESGGVE